MKRFLLLLLLCASPAYAQYFDGLPAASSVSNSDIVAICQGGTSGVPGTCTPRRTTLGNALSGTSVIYPSLHADGVTSDDVALSAAVNTCAAAGGTLVLPAGKILLTGAATITLRNCAIVGAGIIGAASGSVPSFGTTILLTSTSVKPFLIQSDWSISGVNFYWPNQTNGTTVYPPLFSDDGSTQSGNWWVDHVGIVNAYQGFSQTVGVSWGAYVLSNSWMYAVKDLFKVSAVGDMPHFSNMHFTPNQWLQICNFSGSCTSAINAADQVNSLFHIINSSGGVFQLVIGTSDAFAFRYGFLIDASGAVGASEIDVAWDDVATIIDTSSGGLWNVQNHITGTNASCGIAVYGGGASPIGNYPCFNLGSSGALRLDAFHSYGARGSFIVTAGAGLYIKDGVVDGIGSVADGSDYSVISATAGGFDLVVQNTRMSGINASTKVHGINTGTNVLTVAKIEGNTFDFFNEDLNINTIANGKLSISNNLGSTTQGTASVILHGTDSIRYWGNVWDKPPAASVSSCGTGATVAGGIAGAISVGSTNPTTACTLTLPFSPFGGSGGNCTFTGALGYIISGGPSGSPPVWSLAFSGDMHGSQVFFNCPGNQ